MDNRGLGEKTDVVGFTLFFLIQFVGQGRNFIVQVLFIYLFILFFFWYQASSYSPNIILDRFLEVLMFCFGEPTLD